MKHFGLIVLALGIGLLTFASRGFAESYPGEDRQIAEQLEDQASAALDSAHQANKDTRTAQMLFDKARYEISNGKSENAQRYFRMSMDSLRPAPAGEPTPVLSASEMPVVPEPAPIIREERVVHVTKKKVTAHRHHTTHRKHHHHHERPAE